MTIQIQHRVRTYIKPQHMQKLARFITDIGSPPVVGIAGALLIANVDTTPFIHRWTAFYVFSTIILPAFYVVWLVKSGQVTDVHLPIRTERFKPMLFTQICNLLVVFILAGWCDSRLLLWFAIVNLVQGVIFAAITFYWQISLHAATASAGTALAIGLFGWHLTPLLFVTGLICWSRLYLKKHTFHQLVAGCLLAFSVFSTGFYMLGGG